MASSPSLVAPALPPKDAPPAGTVSPLSINTQSLPSIIVTVPTPAPSSSPLTPLSPISASQSIRLIDSFKPFPIKIYARARLPNAAEALKKDNAICVEILKAANTIRVKRSAREKKDFVLDGVFGFDDHQKTVYDNSVRDVIANCLSGYNCCICAYGQTGSGKSFTMQGPTQPSEDQYGIIQRVALQIFNHVDEMRKKNPAMFSFSVKLSCLELFNERLGDLLGGDNTLKIRQDPEQQIGHAVQGASEYEIASFKDFLSLEIRAKRSRAQTNNIESKSHLIYSFSITERNYNKEKEEYRRKQFLIRVVDMAGSESTLIDNLMPPDTSRLLKETTNTNKSIAVFNECINSITTGTTSARDIPFHESKLTYILNESLGGNCITVIIACISPTLACYEESLSTLKSCQKTRTIRNQAKINTDKISEHITKLEMKIDGYEYKLKHCTCGAANLDKAKEDSMSSCSYLSYKFHLLVVRFKKMFLKHKVSPGQMGVDNDKTKPQQATHTSVEIKRTGIIE